MEINYIYRSKSHGRRNSYILCLRRIIPCPSIIANRINRKLITQHIYAVYAQSHRPAYRAAIAGGTAAYLAQPNSGIGGLPPLTKHDHIGRACNGNLQQHHKGRQTGRNNNQRNALSSTHRCVNTSRIWRN